MEWLFRAGTRPAPTILLFLLVPSVQAGAALQVAALSKGPNQINLTWSNPGGDSFYGSIVEIQSDGDSRYSSFTEIQPIATASGYMCDPSATYNGVTGCTISDPGGAHLYNPPIHGVPSWVAESQYVDPQDGSAAQFIVWGLKNHTTYNFRVRTYTGNTSPTYGAYSPVASATTANYTLRYVSPIGNDGNDGSASDSSHAWKTIRHGSNSIDCGQELIVMGGSYASDALFLNKNCGATNKEIVLVNPGDTASITSEPADLINNGNMIAVWGSHNVVDGLASTAWNGNDYDWLLGGDHNALLGIRAGPSVIPTSYGGVNVLGTYDLVYGSYIHDYGSPDSHQNPNGQGGFPLHISNSNNIIWSNHLTRGGHDSTLCNSGCMNNRFLNNVYDGGWGMAFEVVYDNASNNLFEGAISKDAGVLESNIYKPAFELSNGQNTVRRSIFAGYASKGIEISAYGSAASNHSNLAYNNVLSGGTECYFQSHNLGVSAYDGDLVQNNICTNFTGNSTEIYLNNATPNALAYNTFLQAGGNGSESIIVWNQDAGGSFQYSKTLAYADANYGPAVAHNKGLDVDPRFVDESSLDFHLSDGSPLRGAGTIVSDPIWPVQFDTQDLGAFGVERDAVPPPPSPTVNTRSLFSPQVYPNPWRSDKHAAHPAVTFAGLTVGTTIKIFTVSGHLAKELHTDNSSLLWDLINDSGDKVASGVYVYLITDGQGDKVRGKVGIIK